MGEAPKALNMNDLKPEMSDVQKLYIGMNSLNAVVNDLAITVNHDHKILVEGNGEPPIIQKVADMKNYLDGVKFWTRAVALALLAQTITFGVATAIAVIQILPVLQELAKQGTP